MNSDRRYCERHLGRLQPGTVIEVDYPIFKHYAIVSDRFIDGLPTLIALSRRTGRVTEEPWTRATAKRRFEISPIAGDLPGDTVVSRARFWMQQGIVRYNLLTFNCEHFVRLAHGLPVESVQVRRAVKGACIGMMSALLIPQLTLGRALLLTGVGTITGLRRGARN